jgi:hypothetical protein
VYAEPFYYDLDKLSYEQMRFTKAFCILSVYEVGCQTGLIRQQYKDMCVTWHHVTIIINAANKHAQFCGVARLIHWSMALIFFFQVIKPLGVSQSPSQSFSLTAH